jgi:ABC-type transport system involved in multi-copper enzyme maturation permease subunit
MMWVTWRQHRIEALVGGLVLMCAIVFLVVTGLNLVAAYQNTGVASCVAQHVTCVGSRRAFGQYFHEGGIAGASLWLNFLPLLVGMFIGAPMVARELEQGTHRLAWTQSITRFRWMVVKLGLLIGVTLLAFMVLDAFMIWWNGPIDSALGPWETFDLQGTVPLAYALFGLVLGMVVGTLVRRSVPAMAITIVAFLLLRLLVATLVRPHFLPPLSYTWPGTQNDPRAYQGDLVINQTMVDRFGHQLSAADISRLCSNPALPKGGTEQQTAFMQCVDHFGFLNLGYYQPADRFWLFQGIETTLFLALAVALVVFTIWWVARRAT